MIAEDQSVREVVGIVTPHQFFRQMERLYLKSPSNPCGCTREEIHEAIWTGEHDLFDDDPDAPVVYRDLMRLDHVPEKLELLADWYFYDRIGLDEWVDHREGREAD